ncbi:hypothetical protein BGZ83_001316 [Gryganskiella cystojenkinii]|nr:hypothetical protein BGZ83_001316 [Gryganskiella cystojenkinii]
MAGSKSTTAASGRVQKKKPTTKPSSSTNGSASMAAVYSGVAKGTTDLPVARVKRIIKEDKDIGLVSNDAVFLISLATEFFLESFTQKAFNLAKIDKKKSVFYKHLDVIPKSMPLTEALELQRAEKESEENGGPEATAGESEQEQEDEEEDPRSETEDASRPMSEDEGELSAPEDMDED